MLPPLNPHEFASSLRRPPEVSPSIRRHRRRTAVATALQSLFKMPRLVRIPDAFVNEPANESEALSKDSQPKITDHFRPNTEEVVKKKRGRRTKKRAAVAAKNPIIICEVRPRNKEQRRAAKGLQSLKPPPESLLPDSPAGRVKKRHAHKAVSKAKCYSSLTSSQKKITSSTTAKKRKNGPTSQSSPKL